MPVELNTLITAVVRAVLDQLDTRPASVAQVLAPRDEALARQVEKRLGSAMQVCFQGQSAGQEPVLYILPELSCPDMADLALGRGSSLAQREVLDLLLQGKQVRTLGFAYRAHAATAPDALLRLYEEYEARLAAFGLTELTEAAPEASRTAPPPPAPDCRCARRPASPTARSPALPAVRSRRSARRGS